LPWSARSGNGSGISQGTEWNPPILTCESFQCCHDNYSCLVGVQEQLLIRDGTRRHSRFRHGLSAGIWKKNGR
jgi:hypothetical protein